MKFNTYAKRQNSARKSIAGHFAVSAELENIKKGNDLVAALKYMLPKWTFQRYGLTGSAWCCAPDRETNAQRFNELNAVAVITGTLSGPAYCVTQLRKTV